MAVHGHPGTIQTTTAVLTSLGYSGEFFDTAARQQYLRARFYNPTNGRFNRLDPFAGNPQDPQSLHKYAYVHGDPANMVDPTGEFGIGGAIAIGGIAGALIGGIDTALGGGDVTDIAAGVLTGAAFGGLIGAGAFLFPAFFGSTAFTGLGFGLGAWSAYQAFSEGKNAQGAFRVITGLAAPLALRQAAITRLTTAARQIRLNLAKAWRKLPLRSNFYGAEPGVVGAAVASRLALTPNVKPGTYLYVIDGKGRMWLHRPVGDIKHSSILPSGAKARAAGWIKINADRSAKVNTRSGHYMQESPLSTDQELIWLQAITETLLMEGNVVVENAGVATLLN